MMPSIPPSSRLAGRYPLSCTGSMVLKKDDLRGRVRLEGIPGVVVLNAVCVRYHLQAIARVVCLSWSYENSYLILSHHYPV